MTLTPTPSAADPYPRAAHGAADPAPPQALIAGAGPAGLAMACALADIGWQATVVDPQPAAALAQPAPDGREIALTHRARRVLQRLGWWDRLPAEEISPLQAAAVADGPGEPVLRFGRDGDEPPLGWLVPNHRLRAAGFAALRQRPGVRLIDGRRVVAFAAGADRASVTLDDGACLSVTLVVAADSRFSSLRRLAGIGASLRDFGRVCIVAPVLHERPHDGVARECFRHGLTLALLPMPGRQSSVVVTVSSDRADEWMAMDDAAFAARVLTASGGQLGAIAAAGARHAYPLVGVYAQRFAGERIALVGDAAVGMHPVTAHGFNFGLYGVEVLARELLRHGPQRLDAALRAYAREHRRVTAPVYWGTNALVSLFTDERPLARRLRPALLQAAQHAPLLSSLVRGWVERQLRGGPPAREAAAPATPVPR